MHYVGGYTKLILDDFRRRGLHQEASFIKPYLKVGQTILDCGCGPGSISCDVAAVISPGKVSAIDISHQSITQAKQWAASRKIENIGFQVAEMTEVPFSKHTFDVVYAHAALYHVREYEKALKEIKRVLKPNGILALRDLNQANNKFSPSSDALDRAWTLIEKVFDVMGSDVNFGSKYESILPNFGFEIRSVENSFDVFASDSEKESITSYWAWFLGEEHYGLILKQQLATESEIQSYQRAFHQWEKAPNSIFRRARRQVVANAA